MTRRETTHPYIPNSVPEEMLADILSRDATYDEHSSSIVSGNWADNRRA